MRLLDRLTPSTSSVVSRSTGLDTVGFGGVQFPLGVSQNQRGTPLVDVPNSFVGYVQEVANRDGIVSACVAARALLVSQLRFKWRDVRNGPQSSLFTSESLAPLQTPQPGVTRSRLFHMAEQHASYAGNAYFWLGPSGQLRLLRPDWVSLLLGSDMDPDTPADQLDAEILGVIYRPGGRRRGAAQLIPASEVAQWAPEPDPLCGWRGQSWVTSVLMEVASDQQATGHMAKFYENAATPQLVFIADPTKTPDQVREWAKVVNAGHAGVDHAYKNLFLGGGADVRVVGAQLAQLDLAATQSGHESRIVARSRVPAVVLGSREGLSGSSLNSGNYNSARRMWADGWFSGTADGLAETLEPLIEKPPVSGGFAELTYDSALIDFLQEDRKDEAEIQRISALTIRQYTDAGFTAASAVEAVRTGDLSKLVHSGLFSVQLQKPGTPNTSTSTPAAPDQGEEQ